MRLSHKGQPLFFFVASKALESAGIAADYYNILKGFWNDGVPMQYGGYGHPNSGATGRDCNFMFPDLSDNCNWGTNGVQPPGFITGAGGACVTWIEANVGDPPGDRRGNFSMGPFTFQPGDKQELDLAFVWARQYTDSSAMAAVTLLKTRIDMIRNYFNNDSTPCGGSFSGIDNTPQPAPALVVYLNPATTILNVHYTAKSNQAEYAIYNIMGQLIARNKILSNERNQIAIDNLTSGIYFLVIYDDYSLLSRRFIKR